MRKYKTGSAVGSIPTSINQFLLRHQAHTLNLLCPAGDPLCSVCPTRVAACAFTDSIDKRREKIITRIRKSNAKAASAIIRISPFSQHMFGGDHNQLSKVVGLYKDLSAMAEISGNKRGGKGSGRRRWRRLQTR